MKTLILVIAIFMVTYVAYSHDFSKEYKVVCEIAEGCPIVNGTCPTCVLVGGGPKKLTSEDWAEWGKQLKESLRYQWDSDYFKDDTPEKKPSGWGWDGPTWKGLRVLY